MFCCSDGSSVPANVPIKRIGGHHATHQIVVDRVGDRLPDGSSKISLPGGRASGSPAAEDPTRAWLRVSSGSIMRRPQPLRDHPDAAVELGECPPHRRRRRSRRTSSGARSAARSGPRSAGSGVYGRVAPPGQSHPRAEVVDDARRQQADQIRVARQPGVDTLETRAPTPPRHRRGPAAPAPAPAARPAPGRRRPPAPLCPPPTMTTSTSCVAWVSSVSQVALDLVGRAHACLARDRRPSHEERGAGAADPSTGPVATSSARSRCCSSVSPISWCCSLARKLLLLGDEFVDVGQGVAWWVTVWCHESSVPHVQRPSDPHALVARRNLAVHDNQTRD